MRSERIKLSFLVAAALSWTVATSSPRTDTLPAVRPPVEDRTFQSTAIDNLINTVAPLFADPNLGTLFSNCLPNTLDTTVYYYTSAETLNTTDATLDTFIITGDIEAMWLRDSTNQVLPYIPYGPSDPDLQLMLEGLIARQAHSVHIDPFANAFNFNASGEGHQSDQRTPPMGPAVFEGKYEIDSLNAFLKVSYWHWRYSGDDALVRFATPYWLQAVGDLLDTGIYGICMMFVSVVACPAVNLCVGDSFSISHHFEVRWIVSVPCLTILCNRNLHLSQCK